MSGSFSALLRVIFSILFITLLFGCAAHHFPIVQPVEKIPKDRESKARAKDYFLRARDYERRGLDKWAERYYEMAYEHDSSSSILKQQVIRKYIESSKFTQALLLLKANRTLSDLNDNEKRLLSNIYLKMGEFAQAADALEAIPYKSEGEIYTLGLIYESMGNTEKALKNYNYYFERNPRSIQLALKIGALYLNEKKYAAAESLFVNVLETVDENPAIYTRLGMVRVLQGDTVSAFEYYDKALALDSTNEDALRSMAQIYLNRGDYKQAISLYEELYKTSVYGEIYGKTLAMLYYHDKRYADAETLLQDLLVNAMGDYEMHYYMGLTFSALGKDDMARIEVEKALSLNDGYADAWRQLCYLFVRQKEYEQALNTADRFIEIAPEASESWRLKGYVYNIQKQYDDAVEVLSKAVQFDSSDSYAWFELGSAYERQKNIADAARAFRRVLDLRPKDPTASNYLGYMWAEQGMHLDSAKVLLETALNQEPENGAYLDSYAWIFYQMGDIEKAYEYMQKALEKIDDDPVIYSHLGDILRKRGDYSGAMEAYRKSLELDAEDEQILRDKIIDLESQMKSNR